MPRVGIDDNFFALGGRLDPLHPGAGRGPAAGAWASAWRTLFRAGTVRRLAETAGTGGLEPPTPRTAPWAAGGGRGPAGGAGRRGGRLPSGRPAGGDALPQRVEPGDGRLPRRLLGAGRDGLGRSAAPRRCWRSCRGGTRPCGRASPCRATGSRWRWCTGRRRLPLEVQDLRGLGERRAGGAAGGLAGGGEGAELRLGGGAPGAAGGAAARRRRASSSR